MQAFTQKGDAIINGALAYVGAKAKIGTVGWCFGGGLSYKPPSWPGKQAGLRDVLRHAGRQRGKVEKKLNCDVLNIWSTGTMDKQKVMDKFDQPI